jgi:hypothetical protein
MTTNSYIMILWIHVSPTLVLHFPHFEQSLIAVYGYDNRSLLTHSYSFSTFHIECVSPLFYGPPVTPYWCLTTLAKTSHILTLPPEQYWDRGTFSIGFPVELLNCWCLHTSCSHSRFSLLIISFFHRHFIDIGYLCSLITTHWHPQLWLHQCWPLQPLDLCFHFSLSLCQHQAPSRLQTSKVVVLKTFLIFSKFTLTTLNFLTHHFQNGSLVTVATPFDNSSTVTPCGQEAIGQLLVLFSLSCMPQPTRTIL